MKGIYGKFNDNQVYNIDYLMNEELTDSDLSNLLNGSCLNYSLVVAEFKFNGEKRNYNRILMKCKNNDNWFDDNTWTEKQQNDFRNILAKVYKNIYYYSDQKCLDMADMWLLNFGFRCIHE